MTVNELIKQLLLSYNNSDKEAFLTAAHAYIEREKRMKHFQVARDLEKALFDRNGNGTAFSERRFKNQLPIPRDSEKGFPLLEVKHCEESYENLIINDELKNNSIKLSENLKTQIFLLHTIFYLIKRKSYYAESLEQEKHTQHR